MSTSLDRPSLLLLSSNRRRRYAEDVLTALALPTGAIIQFRYGADYVANNLQTRVADRSIVNTRALLAFVADYEDPLPFMLPIRYGVVVHAECVADIYIFRIRVAEFANVDSFPTKEADIRTYSKGLIDKLSEMNGNAYYPAVARIPEVFRSGGQEKPRAALACYSSTVGRTRLISQCLFYAC